jgi:hypothetical protein
MKRFRVPDPVSIDLARRREPGVEFRRYLAAGNDSDTGRKIGIQSNPPSRSREPFGRDVDVSSLSQGMHTRIRSPGAVYLRRSIQDLHQRRFDVILDRVPVRLALPAGKRLAVIGDGQMEAFNSGWKAKPHRRQNSKLSLFCAVLESHPIAAAGGEPLWNVPKDLMFFSTPRRRRNPILNKRLPQTTARIDLPIVAPREFFIAQGPAVLTHVETFPGAAC